MARTFPSRPRAALALVGGVTVGGVLAAPVAFAHTGHPLDGAVDGLVHPVLGVDHLLAIVAVGVLAALTADRRIAWLTPVGFLAGLAAGGAVGMAWGSFGGVEAAVAASVLLLGVVVATGPGRAGWWTPFAAAALGAVHGVAHGAELPGGASPVLYAVGFLAATAALAGLGAAAGRGLRRLPSLRLAGGAAIATVGATLLLGLS